MIGNTVSGGISPELAEATAITKTVPQDCIKIDNSNPIRKKIRTFIEAKALRSIDSVRKWSPLFIKERARRVNERAIHVLLIVTIFSLLVKKVSPIAPKKRSGKVAILISKLRPIVASNASVIVVPTLDQSIIAIPPVTVSNPVPTKASTSTDIRLLLCIITVETNQVTTDEVLFDVNFLISFLNPVLENLCTASVK